MESEDVYLTQKSAIEFIGGPIPGSSETRKGGKFLPPLPDTPDGSFDADSEKDRSGELDSDMDEENRSAEMGSEMDPEPSEDEESGSGEETSVSPTAHLSNHISGHVSVQKMRRIEGMSTTSGVETPDVSFIGTPGDLTSTETEPAPPVLSTKTPRVSFMGTSTLSAVPGVSPAVYGSSGRIAANTGTPTGHTTTFSFTNSAPRPSPLVPPVPPSTIAPRPHVAHAARPPVTIAPRPLVPPVAPLAHPFGPVIGSTHGSSSSST